jgi:hypothetical protein
MMDTRITYPQQFVQAHHSLEKGITEQNEGKFPYQVTPEMQCELCLLDKTRLAKIVRAQEDDRSAVKKLLHFLKMASEKNIPDALNELANTLIKHYGENIPSTWHSHIKLAADAGHSMAAYMYGKILLQNYNPTSSISNFFLNPLKEIREYFHKAAGQGHIGASKALTEVGDYSYSKELGNRCVMNPNDEMPASDAIKYLSQAANMNKDDEAAASLVHIFERYEEDDYRPYFANGTVKNKAHADQLAQQYRKKDSREIRFMTGTKAKFELHDEL